MIALSFWLLPNKAMSLLYTTISCIVTKSQKKSTRQICFFGKFFGGILEVNRAELLYQYKASPIVRRILFLQR